MARLKFHQVVVHILVNDDTLVGFEGGYVRVRFLVAIRSLLEVLEFVRFEESRAEGNGPGLN